MTRYLFSLIGAAAALLMSAGPALAQNGPYAKTADVVNQRMVKVFGSGGFKGLAGYGTGIVISPDGYVLTVYSHLLNTQDLRVHMPDGRRFDQASKQVKLVVSEPVLDLAIIKVDVGPDPIPYFDVPKSAKAPLADTGDWALAFSNCFEIATRDEPMTVQRGTIASYSKLHLRRGVTEAAYGGEVYVVDGIINNLGAAGGALTNRKGELLGIIGKEYRNTLTETWINYAIPVQAKVDVELPDNKKVTVSIAEFVEKGVRGQYESKVPQEAKVKGPQVYHGVVLVPDVIEKTPAFVEEVLAGSPAAKAGIKPDDQIVYVDGEQVTSIKYFNEIMSKAKPGIKVSLEVRRGGALQTIEFTLAEMPKGSKTAPKPEEKKP
jgi:serine protease Do